MLLKIFITLLPWVLRRHLLIYFFKYDIHSSAKMGFCWVFPNELIMGANSKIDHFNVAIHLNKIHLDNNSSIGRSNWITGFPSKSDSKHFKHEQNRQPELRLGQHSSITKHHHIDCTNLITIGNFTTIAGYYSQFITHSINIYTCRQESNPIKIGDYCFIGTNSVILGGSTLPNCSVLGAKSMLNKVFIDGFALYAGNPAKKVKNLPSDCEYFLRKQGFVI